MPGPTRRVYFLLNTDDMILHSCCYIQESKVLGTNLIQWTIETLSALNTIWQITLFY